MDSGNASSEPQTLPIRRHSQTNVIDLPEPPDPPVMVCPPDSLAPVPLATQDQESPAPPPSCPRCQGKLTDPRGLGWCQACGYCRSLEEEREKVPLPKTAPASRPGSSQGLVECGKML